MSFAKGLIGIMVAVIIGVGVTLPVISELITNSTFTGTTAIVLGLLPLLVVVAIVMAVVAMYA